MKNSYLFILACFCLSSCYTVEGLAGRTEATSVSFNKDTFKGLYENQIPNDDDNSLWNDLCLHYGKKKTVPPSGNQVYMEVIDEKNIVVELYDDDYLIDEMTLPGKMKEDYFVIRRGSHFFSLIFITSTVSKKTILGNDTKSDLILAQGNSSNVILMDLTSTDDEGETITATYMRLGDDRPSMVKDTLQ